MTINIKSVGGRVLCLSASVPTSNYAATAAPASLFDRPMPPVIVRKSRMTTTIKLNAAMVRIRAKSIVQQQRELREQFIHF